MSCARRAATANAGTCPSPLVEAAGGKVVTARTPIPGMGAYARVADTEGNIVGLFESRPEGGVGAAARGG